MKSTLFSLLTLAGFGVTTSHHGHGRHHLVKKAEPGAVRVAVVVVCELDGRILLESECKQGIANGTLIYAPDGGIVHQTPSVALPSSSSAKPAPVSTPSQAPPVAPAPASAPQSLTPSGGGGCETDFPDGVLDCTTFPSTYGAVKADYLNLGGWIGIQNPKRHEAGGYADIETVVSNQCPDGNCCRDGMYCSYMCPPGYQKAQWPATQGSTGQSVGGIKCKDGKLFLTNRSFSPKLCIKGTDAVQVKVVNKMSKGAAVCRTDYPGSESETVALDATPGSTTDMTCPDSSNYYKWLGGKTSAQYYVNPAGVSIQDGCRWGTPGVNVGNYAPMNLGVGYSDGKAWLSIFQNFPTTMAKLDFCVEVVGDGGNMIGKCKYSNGKYCSGEDYSVCNDKEGCTVTVTHGTVSFIFS